MKHFSRIGLGTFVLFVLVFSSDRCTPSEPGPPSSPKTEMTMGYTMDTFSGVQADLKDARAATRVWMDIAAKEFGKGIVSKTVIYEDYPSLIAAIATKEVDMVGLLTLEYLRIRNEFSLEPFSVGMYGGSVTDEYLLLVRKDEGIKTLSQLKGKILMIETSGSHEGIPILWLDTRLMKDGLPNSKNFFSLTKNAVKASQVILPVFFKQADACLVVRRAFDTMVELNPQVGERLELLAVSPSFLRGIACFRGDFDDAGKKLAREMILQIHTRPKGRQLMTLFQVDKMVEFKPSYLKDVVALVEEYEALKRTSAKK